ncbi:MAG: hypothetical protein DI539_18665 [Flavobacterium psychrophilum]|nr:MAG: hypothetical protein DI539_18665 [Flavobacterium psychrophilum]
MKARNDIPDDWFWEGKVVETLVHHLEKDGWHLLNIANTASRARGHDIQAQKENRILLIEVKGYPSTSYRDPNRAHEKKRTQPTLQAQHWYAQVLLKAMRLQTSHPNATVAIGLPDFPRYRTLFDETRFALQRLNLQIWGVSENGEVTIW